MGQLAAVAVVSPPAVAEGHVAPEGERGESRLGLLGQRPGLEARPAQRQLRGLDADEAHRSSVVEQQRIAVDHLDHPGPLGKVQRGARGTGPGKFQEGENQEGKNQMCKTGRAHG